MRMLLMTTVLHVRSSSDRSPCRRPLTGNDETDPIHNRTKRLFNDKTGIRCGVHTGPVLVQTYRHGTGEVMYDLSLPIFVIGQHWRGFRVGYPAEAKDSTYQAVELF
jgi:hypothetical protein